MLGFQIQIGIIIELARVINVQIQTLDFNIFILQHHLNAGSEAMNHWGVAMKDKIICSKGQPESRWFARHQAGSPSKFLDIEVLFNHWATTPIRDGNHGYQVR